MVPGGTLTIRRCVSPRLTDSSNSHSASMCQLCTYGVCGSTMHQARRTNWASVHASSRADAISRHSCAMLRAVVLLLASVLRVVVIVGAFKHLRDCLQLRPAQPGRRGRLHEQRHVENPGPCGVFRVAASSPTLPAYGCTATPASR